jgi:gliding motility-associated-like protein
MKRNILPLFASLLLLASTLYSNTAKSQAKLDKDAVERVNTLWKASLENVRLKYKASENDFRTFEGFEMTPIQLLKIEVLREARKVNSDPTILAGTLKEAEKSLGIVYEKFLETKKEFPSSVAEFEHPGRRVAGVNPCDSSGCTNMGFDDGTFNTWYGYYQTDNSTLTAHVFSLPVGGALGPVSQACNDPIVMANMNASYAAGLTTDYQMIVTSSGADAMVPSISRVTPFGGKHSCMLGDSSIIYAGSATLTKTFYVTAANANLTYQYAVILQNPGHNYYQQPFFTAAVLDELGDTIPNCGVYNVVSGPGLPGFHDTILGRYDGNVTTYWRPWTIVNLPLKHYINQCVTIIFQVADCEPTGHFGYAYVSASCQPYGVISSSPALCGQKTITLTAPPGGTSYAWTGPPGNSIVGANNTQVITVDSAGTYQVIETPVTGVACNDTIQFTVGRNPGPPPKPSFFADTVCQGQATDFTNLSNPIGGGARFYWDFYNLGSFNDTVDVNPTWTYAAPGVYTVKLQEEYKGCGYDTLVKVKVDSIPKSAFTATQECLGVPVTFTNTSSGASGKYYWNFGDPSSGTADTSTVTNPTHTFDTAGTYTIMLVSKNPLCRDTLRQTIKVYAMPVPTISGTDSICPGGSATINAGGGISYLWSTGATTSSITGFPASTKTFTVTVSNGTCSKDTTFTVVVKPVPIPNITTAPDTICVGDSSKLTATGGGTYIWTFSGSPDSIIWVKPGVTTTYTCQVTKHGCIATTSKTVTVISAASLIIGVRNDSICPTDSTYIYASGGSSYKWLPSGITIDSIKAKTNVTKTYTVVITNSCGVDTLTATLHIAPVPIIKPKGVTICKGSSGQIFAYGGGTYSWTPNTNLTCNNCASPIASPSVTTTYTVTVSNGKCSKDSVVTVNVNPIPIPGITPPQKICACSPATLTGTGGGTYVWSTGATTNSITVSPCTDSTYKVTVSKNGCDSSATTTITVSVPVINVCCDTTIIKDSSGAVSLTASGGGSYLWTPNNGLSCDTCAVTLATPTVTTTYTVYSTNSFGCKISTTVTIFVEIPCADFKVPNVFTPNDDGRNDDFVINILNPTSYSIVIYDRWGSEVYTSTDPTVYWTGHLLSTQYMVPDGVYYYIIKSTCGSNNYTKDGFVQVIGGK